MSAAETGQMSAVETKQMSTIATGLACGGRDSGQLLLEARVWIQQKFITVGGGWIRDKT